MFSKGGVFKLAGGKVAPPHVTEQGHLRKTVLGTLENNFLIAQILFQIIRQIYFPKTRVFVA